MKHKKGERWFRCLFLSLVLFLFSSIPAWGWDLWVTSPWLAVVARFIGGPEITLHPMSVWNAEGAIIRVQGAGSFVVALDPREAKAYGLSPSEKRVALLYQHLPKSVEAMPSLYLDPSALPFISQRLLGVIAKRDPAHYPFYQRRLAEFQARLESTLTVGRQLLGQITVLDLTGQSSPWIRASVEREVRPPDPVWISWAKGVNLEALKASLAEAQKRGWFIIVDPWTPGPIKAAAIGSPKTIALEAPNIDQELFLYLYDQYVRIWNHTRVASAKIGASTDRSSP